MSEHNPENEIFKKLSMHVKLRGGIVNLYGTTIDIDKTHYQTEVKGTIIHEFTDEHTLTRHYMLSYFSTALYFIKAELEKIGISDTGLGKEAVWNISWTEIKESK